MDIEGNCPGWVLCVCPSQGRRRIYICTPDTSNCRTTCPYVATKRLHCSYQFEKCVTCRMHSSKRAVMTRDGTSIRGGPRVNRRDLVPGPLKSHGRALLLLNRRGDPSSGPRLYHHNAEAGGLSSELPKLRRATSGGNL
jgi:hypothetical protein